MEIIDKRLTLIRPFGAPSPRGRLWPFAISDVRLVPQDCVAHRLRHTLCPPLPPPQAAVGLVAIGKSYASIVDDEKMAFLGGVNIKNPLPSS